MKRSSSFFLFSFFIPSPTWNHVSPRDASCFFFFPSTHRETRGRHDGSQSVNGSRERISLFISLLSMCHEWFNASLLSFFTIYLVVYYIGSDGYKGRFLFFFFTINWSRCIKCKMKQRMSKEFLVSDIILNFFLAPLRWMNLLACYERMALSIRIGTIRIIIGFSIGRFWCIDCRRI